MTARRTLLKTTALSLCFTALAGCNTHLGDDAERLDLRGEKTTLETEKGPIVFTKVKASDLTGTYDGSSDYILREGNLWIEGSLGGQKSNLHDTNVENGTLFINGSVAESVDLSAKFSIIVSGNVGEGATLTAPKVIIKGCAHPSVRVIGSAPTVARVSADCKPKL